MNDVYSMVPIDGLGGLARVATLKQQLAAAGRTPFLVMAGDFLSPSVASSVFKGEQMIAALNAAGLDLATLGNHEFDFGDDVLIQRMREARFEWVVSNVIDTNTGQPIGGAAPYLVKTFGALKVGFLGLCLDTDEITPDKLKHTRIVDPIAAAGQYLPVLKREGATVIVAVTHLAFADRPRAGREVPGDRPRDRRPRALPDHGDREPHAHQQGRVGREGAGAHRRQPDRRRDGRAVLRAAADHRARFRTTRARRRSSRRTKAASARSSKRSSASRACRSTASASTCAASETNLGDVVADAMRADAGTDIAIVNSGSIRGNRIFPAGTADAPHADRDPPVRQRHRQAVDAGTRACCRR